jgi:hypothetical protein
MSKIDINTFFQITAIKGAIIVVIVFFVLATILRKEYQIYDINLTTYYWLMFTVLTGIWELYYLINKRTVSKLSNMLIENNAHVWTQNYPIIMILPNYTSKIFYTEYAAWADRLYGTPRNPWSLIIEGTHCFVCALFSAITILTSANGNYELSNATLYIAMTAQAMNSILYIVQYMIQTRQKDSPNYDSEDFPCGQYLLDRPFMWINIFWTLMPSLIMFINLFDILL